MKKQIVRYLSDIGRVGGKKSRRELTSDEAKKMVKLRDARKYYRLYHAQCFWSYSESYRITYEDIPWVAETLKKYGGRQLWMLGTKLCP